MTERVAWTVREVAAAIGLHYETALGLIHSGELGHRRVGQRYIVPDTELRRWIGECTTTTSPGERADEPALPHPRARRHQTTRK